ncbi:MAG: DUF3857 domain-containing protein [Polyangiales bacterium]|nr:DUF3857 domain-containing protein [Myxococcales bacterium]MCB9656158.1 DUF3857 domain-containing protein [Sandaracinaceae bacterium]
MNAVIARPTRPSHVLTESAPRMRPSLLRLRSSSTVALAALLLVAGCGGSGGGRSTLPEAQPPAPLPIEAVRAAAAAAPDDPARQLALLDAELHDEGGDPATWDALAERVLLLSEGDPRAHLMIARVGYLHAAPANAAEHYLRAIEAAQRTPGASAIAEVAASGLGDLGGLAPNMSTTVAERVRTILENPGHIGGAAVSSLTGILLTFAYRTGDVALVRSLATRLGCITSYRVAGPFGPEAMTGFDRTYPAAGVGPMADRYDLGARRGEQPTRTLETRGCVASLAEGAGRSGPGTTYAEAVVEIPRSGDYWLLTDIGAAYEVSVDGRRVARVDRRSEMSARLRFERVRLDAGRHEVEVRVTARGTNPAIMVALMGDDGLAPAAEAPATTYEPALPSGTAASELSGLSLWVAVRQALDRGDGVGAREYAARMGQRPGAAMQALAIQVAQNDPFLADQQRQTRVLGLVRALAARDAAMWNAALQDARQAAGEGRDQEALATARQMHERWPNIAPVTMFLIELVVQRGWDGEADGLIQEAIAAIPGACSPLYQVLSGAERRGVAREIDAAVEAIVACDATSSARYQRRMAQRRWAEARTEVERLSAFEPPQARGLLIGYHLELARATSDERRTNELLQELRALTPRDVTVVQELGDRQYASGHRADALRTFEDALEHDRPAMFSLVYPRRALFARDELAEFRIDGAQTLRDFEASGRTYSDPSVLVLDYMAVRAFEDGSRLSLTHNIWKMQSEEAVDEFGEFEPPNGAYLLRLQTVKADGTRLEPDLIEGKDTISMPNLQVGDYVEFEYIQYVPPSGAYPNGMVGGRFMFQGFEKPYDRSELVVVVPTSMGELVVDPRGPAPQTQREVRGDVQVYRWRVNESRPLVAENHSISAYEFLPSIGWGIGASWEELFAMMNDELSDKDIVDPAARRLARRIVQGQETVRGRAMAVYHWVTENVESTQGGLFDQAAMMLAGRRGNRTRVMRYLLRLADVPADVVLVRGFGGDQTRSPLPDTDTYDDVLLRIGSGAETIYTTAVARGLSFGYIPPHLGGQDAVVLTATAERVTVPRAPLEQDRSAVDAVVQLMPTGGATIQVRETYVAASAASWRENLRAVPAAELRERFEEGYVAHIVPGARITALRITGREDPEAPLVLEYTFEVPALGRIQGDQWRLPPLFGIRLASRFAETPTRQTTQIIGPIATDVRMRVIAPRGAPAPTPGADANLTGAGGSEVRVASTVEGNATTVTTRVRVPLSRVAPGDYTAFADFCRRADDALSRELSIPLR